MAAETTSEVHHEGGGHGVFPPFDPTHYPSQIFWFVIAFAILYALMSRVALPRVGEIKTMRRDKIASELDDRRGAQPTVEMVVQEHLRRGPERLEGNHGRAERYASLCVRRACGMKKPLLIPRPRA